MKRNADTIQKYNPVLTDTTNVRIKYWFLYFQRNGTPNDSVRQFYIEGVRTELRKVGFSQDKILLYSEIPTIESEWNCNAINRRSGARGMWQIMPINFKTFGGHLKDAYDPYRSTRIAVRILKYLDTLYNGDKDLVLFAYNAGETKVNTRLKRIITSDPWQVKDFTAETYNFAPKVYGAYLTQLTKWNIQNSYKQNPSTTKNNLY